MRPKISAHAVSESYLLDPPRAGIELTIETGDAKIVVGLDFSEASEAALLIQQAVRSTASEVAV